MKPYTYYSRILIQGMTLLLTVVLALTAPLASAQCEKTSGFAKKACEAALQPTPGTLKGSSASASVSGNSLTTGPSDVVQADTLDASINPKLFKPLAALSRTDDGSFVLERGLYEAEVESYLLGPGGSEGSTGAYFPAPMKGSKAEVIGRLLKNAELYPDIPQGDIQKIISALIIGNDLSQLPPSAQKATTTLLPPEIAKPLLAVGQSKRIGQRLAGALSHGLDQAASKNPSNQSLKQAQSIKNAVIGDANETAPTVANAPQMRGGALALNFPRGTWAEMAGGFYLRYLPEGAGRTRIQMFVPGVALRLTDANHPLVFDPTQYLAILSQSPYERIGITLRQPVPSGR